MLQLPHGLSMQLSGKYHSDKFFSGPSNIFPNIIPASQKRGGSLSLGVHPADTTPGTLACGYAVLHTWFADWCWLLFLLQREILYNPGSCFWLCDRKTNQMLWLCLVTSKTCHQMWAVLAVPTALVLRDSSFGWTGGVLAQRKLLLTSPAMPSLLGSMVSSSPAWDTLPVPNLATGLMLSLDASSLGFDASQPIRKTQN